MPEPNVETLGYCRMSLWDNTFVPQWNFRKPLGSVADFLRIPACAGAPAGRSAFGFRISGLRAGLSLCGRSLTKPYGSVGPRQMLPPKVVRRRVGSPEGSNSTRWMLAKGSWSKPRHVRPWSRLSHKPAPGASSVSVI